MYQYDQKPGTHFADSSAASLQAIRDSEYSVLVGRNNCGKSFLLKSLTQQWGQSASYLGPARYQNFNLLGHFTPNQNRRSDRWSQFVQQWQQQQQNIDNSPVNLQQAIAELSDGQRIRLAEIIKTLLGVELEWRQTVEDNSMSQKYISCGGHNISYTSSGFRLITTLVTSLLDADYDTFLIDEPELGISPEAQGILADFLFDREHRARYFPHIKTLVFATHSTIFLDRARISNNYTVQKVGDEISIQPIQSQSDFNGIHFFLLGNRFETLYLPSAIVLVEGKCDDKFIERVVSLRHPESQVSVISANSDSRIKEILNVVKGIFSDIQRSPYKDRIFVVLDSVHSAGLPGQLVAMGIPTGNIVVWPKNGIEYYYPPAIIDKIFGAGSEITIVGDVISRNGLSYNKSELVDKVVSLLQADTAMHEEFEARFLHALAERVG
ncbi:AAA family ATPase [Rhodanobacter sp. OK091]|uniref:ATP-dependent nuclease n=1 Tax=Rhodanobacter sp. OK091 TaxID=1881037 RepID=UPI000911CAA3|nr:AAA family ATPase [Rhodanobacter sp. OK091]SHL55492.1 AAA domain-containing protein, putative AbiEii toxin, Type IV TA system [Rhodanobacter sp. OK091]